MTRVTTWEGVEYLVVTKVFCNIALPWRSSDLSFVRLLEVELVRVELALAGVVLLAEHSQHC